MSTAPSRSPLADPGPGLDVGPRLEDADGRRRGDDAMRIGRGLGRRGGCHRRSDSNAAAGAAPFVEAGRRPGHGFAVARAAMALEAAGRVAVAGVAGLRARGPVGRPPARARRSRRPAGGRGPSRRPRRSRSRRGRSPTASRSGPARGPRRGGRSWRGRRRGPPACAARAADPRRRAADALVIGHGGQTSSRAGSSSRRPAGIEGMPDQRPGSSRLRRRSARPGRSGIDGGGASTSR